MFWNWLWWWLQNSMNLIKAIEFYIFKNYYILYIFNWRIIALRYCAGFCRVSTWIRYTCVPSLSNLPPTSYTLNKWVYGKWISQWNCKKQTQTEIKTAMQQSQQWKRGILCLVLHPFYLLHPVQSWLLPQVLPWYPAAQNSQSVTLEGLEWDLGNSRF